MVETYCAEWGEIRVLTANDTDLTCCECDSVLEITGKWTSEGGK